jgi:hypothetical protein
MNCKNCNNPIELLYTKEKVYVHICSTIHSPNQSRQYSIHIADNKCYKNICKKAKGETK